MQNRQKAFFTAALTICSLGMSKLLSCASENSAKEKAAILNRLCAITEMDKRFVEQFTIGLQNVFSDVETAPTTSSALVRKEFAAKLPARIIDKLDLLSKIRPILIAALGECYSTDEAAELLKYYETPEAKARLNNQEKMSSEAFLRSKDMLTKTMAKAYAESTREAENKGLLPAPETEVAK